MGYSDESSKGLGKEKCEGRPIPVRGCGEGGIDAKALVELVHVGGLLLLVLEKLQ